MNARSENARWLQRARKNWLLLAQGALWIGGVLGGFLLLPPVGVAADEKIWLRLGQFIVAVVLGLEILVARRWHQPRHSLRWAGTAALALLIAVGAFFSYQYLTQTWTANYNGDKVVIGSELTAHGRDYLKKNPDFTTEEVLKDHPGKPGQVWTQPSIDRRRLALAAVYVSCLPLFITCLIALLQALQTSERTATRNTKIRTAMPPEKKHGERK